TATLVFSCAHFFNDEVHHLCALDAPRAIARQNIAAQPVVENGHDLREVLMLVSRLAGHSQTHRELPAITCPARALRILLHLFEALQGFERGLLKPVDELAEVPESMKMVIAAKNLWPYRGERRTQPLACIGDRL